MQDPAASQNAQVLLIRRTGRDCPHKSMNFRKTVSVLGAPIDAVSWADALATVSAWATDRESRVVCICNVHSVVTAAQDPAFGKIVREADMATPDGAPVAWVLRKLGQKDQQRINGPDLMWRYCQTREATDSSLRGNDGKANGSGIFLYGSSQQTLNMLKAKLLVAFPALKIAGTISPPFRKLTPEEDEAIVAQINASGTGVVFVSLGCPKQELWMAEHRGRIQAVMIGVGAAFDYHAGTIDRAPQWMQDSGLEWLHRLVNEPRRLWRRYLVTNSLFMLWAAKQLLLARVQKPK